MTEKDLRPTRYLLTIRYCQDFVTEFFEQNPISQIGIIGMRDGLAVRVSDMSGNPSDHISNLQALRNSDPKGQPSLQNAFDMARAALLYVSHPKSPISCQTSAARKRRLGAIEELTSSQSRAFTWNPRDTAAFRFPPLLRSWRYPYHHHLPCQCAHHHHGHWTQRPSGHLPNSRQTDQPAL